MCAVHISIPLSPTTDVLICSSDPPTTIQVHTYVIETKVGLSRFTLVRQILTAQIR